MHYPRLYLLALPLVTTAVSACGEPRCDLAADGRCPAECSSDPDCPTSLDGGPAAPVFVDMQYATRCDVSLHCSGLKSRAICGANEGDACDEDSEPVRASCTITEVEDRRILDFSAEQPVVGGERFRIRISDATIPMGGGAASATGGCRVQVVEGASRYEGPCGPATPSESQPCQITGVAFSTDPDGGAPVVEGSLLCQFLPEESQPSLQLEVTAVGTGPTAASTPAFFRIRNCERITFDG